MTRVLIISPDIINGRMAGPAIRYWELARSLSKYATVTLAVPKPTVLSDPRIKLVTYDSKGTVIRQQLASHDVILIQGFILHFFPFLKHVSQPLIVDLYDPFLLESLEANRIRTLPHQYAIHSRDLAALLEQIRHGDFFLCASERQRKYWLGMLASMGRIDPRVSDNDAALSHLIDVVPFGLPDVSPEHKKQALKGVVPGIENNDRVIVWGGGTWAWLDPLLLIRAMKAVTAEHRDVRLFFMGKEHPNPSISAVRGLNLYSEAERLAQNLGLLDRFVFFNDQWVEYQDRQNYLLEADIGVSLHKASIEMRYALRTRLLDYVWCGLPMVVSDGDTWSATVKEYDLGQVVPVGDLEALVGALNLMLGDPDLKERRKTSFVKLRDLLTWDKIITPLVRFITHPQKANDKLVRAS